MKVDIKLHHPEALPVRGSAGAAGFDLRAIYLEAPHSLWPGEDAPFLTGISIHLRDPGFAAIILPRSGLGIRGIVLKNTAGLIDSDYSGEIKVTLTNQGQHPYRFEPKERIAQLAIIPVVIPEWNIVESHAHSARGDRGFGHTGRT